jgi:hypothetical protein
MLTIEKASLEPFAYRVSGEPEAGDPLVEVTFTQPVYRHCSGPVLGPATHFCTDDGTGVSRQEARWLADQGVIKETV